jgi:aspartyl-tRNA(Asn)/glutamyl-tRNA(Gln) amidotransferase subunit B
MNVHDKYETVIGLEVHIQLNTNTKAFCSDNAAFGGEPNLHTSPISLAHPGTLPRINKEQIKKAVQLGLALDSRINQVNYFDRKNYFYADLPKGFQTTQDAAPICIGGKVDIEVNGEAKSIRLHHIHMEEDAGKSIHDLDENFTLVDLNRAGVPLLEIVSEPDLRSADETVVFVNELRKLVRFIDISDGNMEEGSMRFDCNISVRLHGAAEYGNRCEVKNMNSVRNAKRAIQYEVERQIQMNERGETVVQETRGFNADNGTTYSLRSKENAPDYRYFPEPDLPPIVLSDEYIETIKNALPVLPNVLKKQFIDQYNLSGYDAAVLTEERTIVEYFSAVIQYTKNYKAAANWLINNLKSYLNQHNLAFNDLELAPKKVADLIALIDDGKVNNSTAKQQLLPKMLESPNETVLELAKQLNLIQDSNDDTIAQILDEVIAKYPDKFEALKKGKKKFMGLFMGEVMKVAKGKANPKIIGALIQERLKG